MKCKVKIKNSQLQVKVKVSSKGDINQTEMNLIQRNQIRGLMKPDGVHWGYLECSGVNGVSLQQFIKKPISAKDFFLVIEQIIDIIERCEKSQLNRNKLLFTLDTIFVNEVTKAVQLIYLPVNSISSINNIHAFIDQLVSTLTPASTVDGDAISKFNFYLRKLDSFELKKVEDYIKRFDGEIVALVKGQVYSTRLNDDDDAPTDIMNHYDDLPTGRLDDEDETGLLDEEDEETGFLEEEYSLYPKLYRIKTEEYILINKGNFRVGKEQGSVDYFVADNPKISRAHADIESRNGKYYITDRNSKNGTYLNERRLYANQKTEIFDGDMIRMANDEFIFYAK